MSENEQYSVTGLESRVMFAVSQDAGGWTVVTPAADTRVVYVSSSEGDDGNSGLSANAPVKTLSKGASLLRDGAADWLLLKRGDTFGSFGEWRKSGRSAEEPILISAYGTGARPQINSGSSYGLITYGKGGATGRSINNLFITSLSFTPHTYNGNNGTMDTSALRLLCQGQNYLIEDCLIDGYKENIDIAAKENGLRNVTIRRNVIIDAHASKSIGHAHGIWVGGNTNGLLIEQNVLDHNGWKNSDGSDRNFFNHNIYVFAGKNVTVKNNIITRASFYGIKMNAGGIAEGNFFARNSESVYLESAATITNNVITEAIPMPTQNWGVGINTQKAPSATISGNLITKVLTDDAAGVAGIQLFNSGSSFKGTVENNIVYNWRNGLLVQTKGAGAGSVVIRGNQLQVVNNSTSALNQSSSAAQSTFVYSGNTYSAGDKSDVNKIGSTKYSLAAWKTRTGESTAQYKVISYPDADRTIAEYAQSLGAGTSFESFIAAARAMDQSTWNANLTAQNTNAWFFRGFGITKPTAPSTPTPNPNPTPEPTPEPEPTPPSDTPEPVSVRFVDDTAPHKIEIKFSDELSSAPKATKLYVRNLTNGKTYAVSSVKLLDDNKTVRFRYNDALPEGNYQAEYDTKVSFQFHVLRGDANDDRSVNKADFLELVDSFGQDNQTAEDGDFNYDGSVSSKDFTILLSKYGYTLKAPKVSTVSAVTGKTLFSALPVSQSSDEDEQKAIF